MICVDLTFIQSLEGPLFHFLGHLSLLDIFLNELQVYDSEILLLDVLHDHEGVVSLFPVLIEAFLFDLLERIVENCLNV